MFPGCSLTVPGREFTFKWVVICAGAASKELLAALHVAVPLVASRSYGASIHVSPAAAPLSRPILLHDRRVVASPQPCGVMCAGTKVSYNCDVP